MIVVALLTINSLVWERVSGCFDASMHVISDASASPSEESMTTDETHSDILDAGRYRNAMNLAVRLLTRRRHTHAELSRKLRSRGMDAQTVAAVMAECERLGYVNDQDAALMYVEELKSKGYGRRHVRLAMKKKGFAADLVDTALGARYLAEEAMDIAKRMAKKKKKSLSHRASGRKLREKLYRYLSSRGFSADTARRAIAAVAEND
jgi:regulatory protein